MKDVSLLIRSQNTTPIKDFQNFVLGSRIHIILKS